MGLAESLHRNVKSIAMPAGMVVGVLLCHRIAALERASGQMITPTMIFLMLFITFCRVRVQDMRLKMMHLWLLLFQVAASAAVYAALLHFDAVVAQGALICALAPVAMAAVVIGGMLGADVTTMATYSLICNMAIAMLAPVALTFTGTGVCTFAEILSRIAPLLIGPFAAAQLCRVVWPKGAQWISAHSLISFYLWLVSLVVIIGRTTDFILAQENVSLVREAWLAGVALVLCLVQFKVGRAIGRRYGDAAAGGQSLGQKNTVLAVWMAQAFLDPISSIAPTAYIVWQNLVNSFQIWRYDRARRVG